MHFSTLLLIKMKLYAWQHFTLPLRHRFLSRFVCVLEQRRGCEIPENVYDVRMASTMHSWFLLLLMMFLHLLCSMRTSNNGNSSKREKKKRKKIHNERLVWIKWSIWKNQMMHLRDKSISMDMLADCWHLPLVLFLLFCLCLSVSFSLPLSPRTWSLTSFWFVSLLFVLPFSCLMICRKRHTDEQKKKIITREEIWASFENPLSMCISIIWLRVLCAEAYANVLSVPSWNVLSLCVWCLVIFSTLLWCTPNRSLLLKRHAKHVEHTHTPRSLSFSLYSFLCARTEKLSKDICASFLSLSMQQRKKGNHQMHRSLRFYEASAFQSEQVKKKREKKRVLPEKSEFKWVYLSFGNSSFFCLVFITPFDNGSNKFSRCFPLFLSFFVFFSIAKRQRSNHRRFDICSVNFSKMKQMREKKEEA